VRTRYQPGLDRRDIEFGGQQRRSDVVLLIQNQYRLTGSLSAFQPVISVAWIDQTPWAFVLILGHT
jgi:hypothetical protein